MASTEATSSGPSKRTRPVPALAGVTSWDPLPETLVQVITSYLCCEELFRATHISKAWHAAINRAITWTQHILHEWPDVHVLVERLEADVSGEVDLCKSLRELCIKILKSEEEGSARRPERTAVDHERLRREADERRAKRFADVFVRIHVVNCDTDQVVYTETVCLSDHDVVRELFCRSAGGYCLEGLEEWDVEAFESNKFTVSLVDFGGSGLRMGELVCVKGLESSAVANGNLARLYSYDSYRCYGFGSEWAAASVMVNCEFMASRIQHVHAENEQEEDDEDESLWVLFVAMEFTRLSFEHSWEENEPFNFQ